MTLEDVATMNIEAGVNVRGDVPDGNWVYLMPTLELGRVLCIGRPAAQMVKTLAAVAGDVRQARRLDEVDGKYDLIYLAGRVSGRDWDALHARLAPHGVVYCETRGRRQPPLPSRMRLLQALWVTPILGRMQTAVPLSDDATQRYFQDHELYGQTLSSQVFDRVRHGWRRRTGLNGSAGGRRRGRASGRLQDLLRRSQNATLLLARRVERRLMRSGAMAGVVRRQGLILSRQEQAALGPPGSVPEYIQEIARASRVDLGRHRWGYMARGYYRSQKLIFFLFAPGSDRPEYIVKMVRDPAFSHRVEREYRSVDWLHRQRVMPEGTFPAPVFYGHHRELAVVGETAIEGRPLRARTSFADDCPYVERTLQWLSDLAVATRAPSAGASLAESARPLMARFVELYRPSNEIQRFLAAQLQALHGHMVPLVFQHGDPHMSNVVVGRDGRVAFLDWESSAAQGPPLWDLLYFLLSWCVEREEGTRGTLDAVRRALVDSTEVSPFTHGAVARYVQAVGMDPVLVQPLFYLHAVFRAVKEAPKFAPGVARTAFYWEVLTLCAERPDAPGLTRLFSS